MQVQDCDEGWVAGQHVRVRIFFGARVFESHPLTIVTAPPKTSCTSTSMGGTLTLAARANGDWSKALNAYAQEEAKGKKGNCCDGKESGPSTVMVMLDGPYGGCSIDLGEYETVLLVAGGSGVTFTLALL